VLMRLLVVVSVRVGVALLYDSQPTMCAERLVTAYTSSG
jgi:hypothetical protein